MQTEAKDNMVANGIKKNIFNRKKVEVTCFLLSFELKILKK